MYSEEAELLRRCTAMRADGDPCRAWALWNSNHQLCAVQRGLSSPRPDGSDSGAETAGEICALCVRRVFVSTSSRWRWLHMARRPVGRIDWENRVGHDPQQVETRPPERQSGSARAKLGVAGVAGTVRWRRSSQGKCSSRRSLNPSWTTTTRVRLRNQRAANQALDSLDSAHNEAVEEADSNSCRTAEREGRPPVEA